MGTSNELKVKIFADGADLAGIHAMYAKPWIKGFTTNPTLMRKAGVPDYKTFAQEVLRIVSDRPVSFEVFADEFDEMEAQALEINSWGPNVNVKIPVTNTKRQFAGRIADTGTDPVPMMRQALAILKDKPKAELLWASPREVLNIVQANEIGCHIITATNDILNKLTLLGKNHEDYSLETVEMFYKDASVAGYTIPHVKRTVPV